MEAGGNTFNFELHKKNLEMNCKNCKLRNSHRGIAQDSVLLGCDDLSFGK